MHSTPPVVNVTAAAADRAEAPPVEVQGNRWSLQPLSPNARLCRRGKCGSPWWNFVSSSIDAPPAGVPTLSCNPVDGVAGFVVAADGGTPVTLSPEPDGRFLLHLASKDVHLANVTDVASIGSVSFVATERGEVTRHPGATSVPLRPLRARAISDAGGSSTVFGAGQEIYVRSAEGGPIRRLESESEAEASPQTEARLVRVWASEHWILRASRGPEITFWDVASWDGSDARVVAAGDVGMCGQPLAGDVALALTSGRLLPIPLRAGEKPPSIPASPLDHSDCVAGDAARIVVTGQHGGKPAVSIWTGGEWSVVSLPESNSVIEPFLGDGFVAIAAAEAPAGLGDGVPAAGTAYILRESEGNWRIDARITGTAPVEYGLLGFNLRTSGSWVFLNHLSGGSEQPIDGDPALCVVEL